MTDQHQGENLGAMIRRRGGRCRGTHEILSRTLDTRSLSSPWLSFPVIFFNCFMKAPYNSRKDSRLWPTT
jgi:hypothetical protein